MEYPRQKTPPVMGQKEVDPTHSAMYGVKLAEKLKSTGVEVVLNYPGHEDSKYKTARKFLIEKLTGTSWNEPGRHCSRRRIDMSPVASIQSPKRFRNRGRVAQTVACRGNSLSKIAHPAAVVCRSDRAVLPIAIGDARHTNAIRHVTKSAASTKPLLL